MSWRFCLCWSYQNPVREHAAVSFSLQGSPYACSRLENGANPCAKIMCIHFRFHFVVLLSLFAPITEFGLVLFQWEVSVLSPMNLDFPEERKQWIMAQTISHIFWYSKFHNLVFSWKCFYYQVISSITWENKYF